MDSDEPLIDDDTQGIVTWGNPLAGGDCSSVESQSRVLQEGPAFVASASIVTISFCILVLEASGMATVC